MLVVDGVCKLGTVMRVERLPPAPNSGRRRLAVRRDRMGQTQGEIHCARRQHCRQALALTTTGEIFIDLVDPVDEVGAVRSPLRQPDAPRWQPGGVWAAPTIEAPGAGALWSMAEDRQQLVNSATIASCMERSTLFWIDTPTGQSDAYDYHLDSRSVADSRTHVTIDPSWGAPDGMCIDADDRLWVACWGGSAVRCFEEGDCVAVVDLPTPLVTCPTFAGPDLNCLVITTASLDLQPGLPGAGDLYVVDAQCRGRGLTDWASGPRDRPVRNSGE